VPPQQVQSAAFVLHSVYSSFPNGTIHVVVVDPGVGTARKGIAMQTREAMLVGPDNGVFSWILRSSPPLAVRALENERYQRPRISPTFHGRDVFAPAAAHLANGAGLESLGTPWTPLISEWVAPRLEAGALHGEVVHGDRFGNVITNITTKDLETLSPRFDRLRVFAADRDIGPLCRTYGDRPPGGLMALIGSCDHLELAVSMGNCAQRLGLKVGDPVRVMRDESRRHHPSSKGVTVNSRRKDVSCP
jgi:hypothetical protein